MGYTIVYDNKKQTAICFIFLDPKNDRGLVRSLRSQSVRVSREHVHSLLTVARDRPALIYLKTQQYFHYVCFSQVETATLLFLWQSMWHPCAIQGVLGTSFRHKIIQKVKLNFFNFNIFFFLITRRWFFETLKSKDHSTKSKGYLPWSW